MAKFCSDECKEQGSICDFCKNYLDEYRDIYMITDDEGKPLFAGDGICGINKRKVSCTDGFDCDDFECFIIEEEKDNEM